MNTSVTDVSKAGLVLPTATGLTARVTTNRDAALDYLRAFVTVLVVAHHSVLAYALYSPAAVPRHPLHPWFAGIPIADSQRLVVFDLFAGFNDIFFMSLMFFLSGLFVWSALARKGNATFLRDRVLRLGVPFTVAALLMPLAYYPAYRSGAADPGFLAFSREWLSLGVWPSGPAWFIWVLLAFNGIAAAVNRLAPGFLKMLSRLASNASRRPTAFFAALVIISTVAYLPMLTAFGADNWVTFGPFSAQSSRSLHYGVYFFAGVAVGASDFRRGLVARDGRLARQWPVWVLAAFALFALNVVLLVAMRPNGAASGVQPLARQLIPGLGFVLCCATISFAMLAVFRRFANWHNIVFDSLSRNVYGIYLVHYGVVLWLQYALLPAALPATAKAAIVFTMALALGWGTTAALRRIQTVARVI